MNVVVLLLLLLEAPVLPAPRGDLTRHKQNPQTTIAVSIIDLSFVIII